MPSTNQGPRRVGQWLYLRPECIDEYKKCHAAVWPEVLEQIKDSNVRDCKSPHSLPNPISVPPFPNTLRPHLQCVDVIRHLFDHGSLDL